MEENINLVTKLELLEQKVEFLSEENKKLWDNRKFLYTEINTLNNIIDCYVEGFKNLLEENKQLNKEVNKELNNNVLQ